MYEQLQLDNQICFRLYTASRLITQSYRPLLEPLGLTYPQYLVMLTLWEHGKLYVCDIAGKLQLETNTVTPLLQRMESQGLITRSRGVDDSRQILVALTPKGKQLEEQAKDVPHCMVDNLQSDKDKAPTEEQYGMFAATLDNMIATLKKPKGK